jgi:hypothetical protein
MGIVIANRGSRLGCGASHLISCHMPALKPPSLRACRLPAALLLHFRCAALAAGLGLWRDVVNALREDWHQNRSQKRSSLLRRQPCYACLVHNPDSYAIHLDSQAVPGI